MIITWFGRNCFRLEGEHASVLTDPYTAKSGLTPPRLTPDIVTASHEAGDEITLSGVRGDTFTVSEPGEFEYRGVFIWGIPTATAGGEHNVAFLIQMDRLNIAHLGDIGHELSKDQLDRLSQVDILLVPVGGKPALNASQAGAVIKQIEPKMVIPMHFAVKGLKNRSAPIADFQKEIGASNIQEQDKLRIKQRDLTGEDMQFVILKRP